MLKFKKIRFKNILSFGNVLTEFDLTESKTTLFQGESGAGKSTILSAFCFGLFGKPFTNIRKNNLLNSINNSDLLVEVEFQKGRKEYKIVRGIKPNIFEIYENGHLISQDAAVIDYQEFLEKQILKFNIKSFLQISILGAANFVPFMQLSCGERRNIIEEVLDIKSFSLMNEIVKQDILKLNSELLRLEHEKRLLEKEIEIHLSYKEKDSKSIAAKRKLITKELSTITADNDKLSLGLKSVKDKLDVIEREITTVNSFIENVIHDKKILVVQKTTEEKRYTDQLKYLEQHDNCDFCLQSIETSHKDFIRNKVSIFISDIEKKYTDKIEELDKKLCQIRDSENFNSMLSSRDKLSGGIKQLREMIQLNEIRISSYNKELAQLDKELPASNEHKIIESNKKKLLVIDEDIKRIIEEKHVCELAYKLLKDDGIKTDIIKEYLPLINSLVNDYLQKMNFFVTFTLDENFNEMIKSRGRDDFEYACFSEGEKQRLDLAILFTWRSIARIKNSLNTNLLIMDEIADSKLNNEAAENVWEVLKAEEFKNSNVFVVSHKNTVADKFERVYQFEKPQNFSSVRLLT